jgi:hypothetical protein
MPEYFVGTFHVTSDVGVVINGYEPVTGGGWVQPRFWVGIGDGGKPFLVDSEADWSDQ